MDVSRGITTLAAALLLCIVPKNAASQEIAVDHHSAYSEIRAALPAAVDRVMAGQDVAAERQRFDAWEDDVRAALQDLERNDFSSAVQRATKALERVRQLGPRHPAVIVSHLLCGVACVRSDDFMSTPFHFGLAAAALDDAVDSAPLSEIALQRALGESQLLCGDYVNAITTFEGVRRHAEDVAPCALVSTLCNLAEANLATGRLITAAQLNGIALKINNARPQPCTVCHALSLVCQGKLATECWNYEKAEQFLEAAQPLLPNGDCVIIANIDAELAIIAAHRRDLMRGSALSKRALDAVASQTGERHPTHVRCLASSAEVALAQGNLQHAHKILMSAAGLCGIGDGSTHPAKAEILMLMGGTYWLAGKLEDANDTYGLACQEFKQANMQLRLATALNSRAVIYYSQNQADNGLNMLSESEKVLQYLPATPHPLAAKNIHDASMIAMQRGQFRIALKGLEHARSEYEQSLGEMDSHCLTTAIHIGMCQAQMGQYEASSVTLRMATRKMESKKWENTPEYDLARRVLNESSENLKRMRNGL